MLLANALVLGGTLALVGGLLLALTWVSLRAARQPQAASPLPTSPQESDLPGASAQDALFLVQQGGKVVHANATARQWFELADRETPNLENLGRRARPQEAFLGLCATSGQARFSVQGHLVEGQSYVLPHEGQPVMLVLLRRPQLTSLSPDDPGHTSESLDIFSQLSQEMSASLDLENTLLAVLANIDRLVSSDFSEITLWEPERGVLVPYRYVGLSGEERQLEVTNERYQAGEGYSGHLIKDLSPLLVEDVASFREIRPAVDRRRFPLQSYLGVPLLIAGEPIGTLELASLSPGSFSQNDLEVLRILSGQAAVAIHNAVVYEESQRRLAELAGLANLAQAVGALRAPQDLFNQLVHSIAPLLEVEILGFLLYEEGQRLLAGQAPFLGMPDQFVALYRTTIEPNSPAEELLLSQEVIVAEDARHDPRVESLGLTALVQAAGVINTALIPLTSGGRVLGYLQAANKRGALRLDESDLRLLTIIAGQAGPIIENATLIQQSRRRARQAEAMRRIASLAGSGATLDEVLKFSLLELARFLQADAAAIFLLDQSQGVLQLHAASAFGLPPAAGERLSRLPIDQAQFHKTVTGSRKPFWTADVLTDERVLPLYRPLVDAMGEMHAVIAVPMEVRDRGIGELLLGHQQQGFYNQNDVQLAATAARQIAGAIERAGLTTQSDEDLRRQVDQLTSLHRVGRELSTTFELTKLLEVVHQEALHATQADCGTILLFDLRENQAGSRIVSLQLGDPLEEGAEALMGQVLASGEASVIGDRHGDGSAAHEGVRATLVVPIEYQNQVVGQMHLHSSSAGHFDAPMVEVAQTLAAQAAIAIGNARRFQDQLDQSQALERRFKALSNLVQAAQDRKPGQPIERIIQPVASAIQEAFPFLDIAIFASEGAGGALAPAAGAGLAVLSLGGELHWADVQTLLLPAFKHSSSYLVPFEQWAALWTPASGQEAANERRMALNPLPVALTPMLAGDGHPLGLVSALYTGDGKTDASLPVRELEIFAGQMAASLESHSRLQQLESQVDELQSQINRAQSATHLAGQQLPVMLHKDLEQTLAIHQLQERAHRMRAGLDIAEVVNHQLDRESVLEAVGLELLARMHFDAALIAEQTPSGPRLLHYISTGAQETNAEALLGQRNPLRQGLQTGEPILVPDLEEDQNWQYAPLLQALKAKGFICLPIATNGHIDAAVLATSQAPLAAFNQEDEQSFSLLAGQISMTLQNLSLLTETQRRLGEVGLLLDFSRQLGSLDPTDLTRTLLESSLRVIPSAAAGWVATWSDKDRLLQPQVALGYAENQRMLEIVYRSGEALPGQAFEAGEPRRVAEVDFAAQYQLTPANLLLFREATAGQLPLSSLIVPLQSGESTLGVLVLDNFTASGAFTSEDQALVTSLAQQAALSLENARLYLAAEQRAAQLQALTRVAGAITSHLDADSLVPSLLDQLASILPFDTGTLWLRDGERLSVRAAHGFEETDPRIGLTVAVEDSRLLGEMIAAGQAIHVPNVEVDARFPRLGEHPYLSWLGIPLHSKGAVTGVIALEKTEPNFYTAEHVLAATTFAGQAAVALDNAALFAESTHRAVELDRRTQRLDLLNRISTRLSQSLDLDRILEFTLQELSLAVPHVRVSAVLFGEQDRVTLQAEMPQAAEEWQPEPLPGAPLFDRLRETLGVFHTADVETESEVAPLHDFLARHNTRALLALPLATGSDLHGLILMHSEKSERFAAGEVELARTICNQAAVALQNARLFEQTRKLTEELEHRVVERTAQLQREHQRTQTLLSIITELSASLDMDIILNRTLALINEISDAGQSTILLVRPEEGALFHRASLGYTSAPRTGGQPTSLKPNEGLAGWVIANRESVLIPDLLADPRWTDNPDQDSEHRSCIAVPLMVGEEALGTLMLFHQEQGHFSGDLLDLIQATAKQIAVAINNAQLFRLIADQSERLGGMLRSQQIETSRSRAILESVADGVLVTDSNGAITLFNASAEEILYLKREVVLDKSIEAFTGLFGGATQQWFDTIRSWSEDPSGLDLPDSFSAQIDLEDERVVAVSLAPVILRNEFLGTVSIFRDITHEVEVDRLKSEFVATVSHELRTPMTSIKGYVEVMLMGAAGELSDQQREYLQVVDSNTRRLNVLVDDLLDISRIEARRVSLATQPVDLREILKATAARLEQRSQDEDRPMSIQLTLAPGLPRVVGDPERIQQIVFNLLDNAYNYTPERGRITVGAHLQGAEVQVDIQDTGIGIPPAEQERVFERFYRGEDPLVLATAGTGLGLSIVRYLIEAHGGRVWIESEGLPGQGTLISFTLPRYTAETET